MPGAVTDYQRLAQEMEVIAVKGLCSPYAVSWFYSISKRPVCTPRAVVQRRSRPDTARYTCLGSAEVEGHPLQSLEGRADKERSIVEALKRKYPPA
jgi:hypothetical protein